MGVLQTVSREHVYFNASNAAHRAAFWQLRQTGRQTDLRFVLEEGYGSVLTMMQDKIACHYSKPKEAPAVQCPPVTVDWHPGITNLRRLK